tara:strand:- start:227 stop:613 length:387 start_codon:yes stop_codon:yes gene_type:complete
MPFPTTQIAFIGTMPKKLQRNFTARRAIIGTEVDQETRCTHSTLWWNVLFQALVDSTNLENPNVTRANHAKEAIKWIFENRKDFETVCGLSGFDPDYFRTRAKKFIKARYSAELLGSVFATHRKNLWR